MFDLRDFITTTISSMVGKEPDYKVREYALGWFNRSGLTQDDLSELDAKIVAYNARPQEMVEPEPEIDLAIRVKDSINEI